MPKPILAVSGVVKIHSRQQAAAGVIRKILNPVAPAHARGLQPLDSLPVGDIIRPALRDDLHLRYRSLFVPRVGNGTTEDL